MAFYLMAIGYIKVINKLAKDVKFVESLSRGDLSGNEVLSEVVPISTSQILLG